MTTQFATGFVVEPRMPTNSDRVPKPASRTPEATASVQWGSFVALLACSIFGGITSVAIPLRLNAAGLGKLPIAIYFVVGGVIVAAYNLGLIPPLAKRHYPAAALRLTAAAVPVGTLLILAWANEPLCLYLGATLMLATTTVVPQIFGIAATNGAENPDVVVFRLRQVMVIGYVLGLGIYAVTAAASIEPLLAATIIASTCALATWSSSFSKRRVASAVAHAPGPAIPRPHTLVVTLLVGSVLAVGLMKGVDTIRGIYLPLFAIHVGIPDAAISPLFIVTAVAELALLPLLARATRDWGEAGVLMTVSALGFIAFVVLFFWRGYTALLMSQVIYAAFAAGFQSIGVVLLARSTGRDVGQGAAFFVTVIQSGAIIGAILPLFVSGYTGAIFLIAAVLCICSTAVCIPIGLLERRERMHLASDLPSKLVE